MCRRGQNILFILHQNSLKQSRCFRFDAPHMMSPPRQRKSNHCNVYAKDENSIREGSWNASLDFSAPCHILGCAWVRKCVLTLSWSWPGAGAHHREIKNHIPPPLRRTEKRYESCFPLQQRSPRYSLLHSDIRMEILGFLSSHSSLLNCLHTYG